MALWQFDCYIVERGKCIAGSDSNDEKILFWEKGDILYDKIDFLERQTCWTKDIFQYGKEDETCIQFLFRNGLLKEIFCRFDLRSLTSQMLKNILKFVDENNGMIFYEGKIYYPDFEDIVKLMKKSDANNFCQNPKKYFDSFSNNL